MNSRAPVREGSRKVAATQIEVKRPDCFGVRCVDEWTCHNIVRINLTATLTGSVSAPAGCHDEFRQLGQIGH